MEGVPAAQALFDPFWGDKRGGETAAQEGESATSPGLTC